MPQTNIPQTEQGAEDRATEFQLELLLLVKTSLEIIQALSDLAIILTADDPPMIPAPPKLSPPTNIKPVRRTRREKK